MAGMQAFIPRRRQVLRLSLGLCGAALLPASVWAAVATGPKKRIAVATFDATGAFLTAAGTGAGDVLADQFSSILAQSNLFDVVDRSDVTMILKEQALTPASATVGAAAADPTELLGAQVIVRGSVTSYDTATNGGGLSLGLGVGDLGGALGQKSATGALGIDFRLVDVTTGRVLGATEIKQALASSALSVGVQQSNLQLNKDSFHNTPLGQASAQVFAKAVPFVAAKLSDQVWTGRVADVVDGAVLLNVGGQNGVAPGQVFAISRITRRIVDPASGEFLGVIEAPVGQVTIAAVQEKFSTAQADPAVAAVRGDVARFVR
jgi:curli biogenesis system outer membrane secretion channel CsgG